MSPPIVYACPPPFSSMLSAADTARELAVRAALISKDAVLSRTYLYPTLGILYLARHPSLWPPVLSHILPCLALSIGVLVPMFLFTYVPQAAVLTILDGPIGPLSAIALVCSESSTIINALARAFLLDKPLFDLFDATLVCEGQVSLVAMGRELKPGKLEGSKKLGKMTMKPLQKFSFASVIQYIIMLPLNLIPAVGTATFLIMQGRKIGPSYHLRYFQLKGYDSARKDAFVKENKAGYIAFGTMAVVMSLVPLASIFFTFTSTVGAALWAAEIEKKASYPGETVDMTGEEARKEKRKKKQL